MTKVLQVVGGMDRGGVETWLMHVLRHIDVERFQVDFLVHTTRRCAYDEAVRALGSKVIPCLHPSRPRTYGRNLKQILRDQGPYDVVHSHVHHFSGYVLRLAHQARVPVRIAHSHSDTSTIQLRAGLQRRFYFSLMKRWISQHATCGLGVSRVAAAALFGKAWGSDPRWRILRYGIDLSPFRFPIDKAMVRGELGLPVGEFVIGHVGSFREVKNHAFLLEILAEAVKRNPEVRLLLVGDGPLRPAIEQQADRLGVSGRVTFAGIRSDVPRLMLGAMDVLVLPSLYEGLPLVLLEAQSAGLAVVRSDVVTEEVDIVKPLVAKMPLSEPASAWAEAVLVSRNRAGIGQPEALASVERTEFDIVTTVRELERVYDYRPG